MNTPDRADDRRFQREVIPVRSQLLAAARRLTHTTQDAEDLTQETLLRAYAGFGSFRQGTNVNAWLHRILHNVWIDQYRKKQSRPAEVSVEQVSDQHLTSFVQRASTAPHSAEEIALDFMTDEVVTASLMALRPDVRTTVYYADVMGLTGREIAAITGSPIGTVMSRLHRGRKRLRLSLFALARERGVVPGSNVDEAIRAA